MDLPALPPGYECRLPPQVEASALVVVGLDVLGRELRLTPDAASAWNSMREAAGADGVVLLAVSGFRSIARQREIVERKLAAGVPWREILRVSAYPGHSEHHTGRAIDIGSPECEHLTESFAATSAFRWLARHAGRFGYSLSYPLDGATGIGFEPWHWLWAA